MFIHGEATLFRTSLQFCYAVRFLHLSITSMSRWREYVNLRLTCSISDYKQRSSYNLQDLQVGNFIYNTQPHLIKSPPDLRITPYAKNCNSQQRHLNAHINSPHPDQISYMCVCLHHGVYSPAPPFNPIWSHASQMLRDNPFSSLFYFQVSPGNIWTP